MLSKENHTFKVSTKISNQKSTFKDDKIFIPYQPFQYFLIGNFFSWPHSNVCVE